MIDIEFLKKLSGKGFVNLHLLRREGIIPSLIRWWSGSDYDHILFLTDMGYILEFNEDGLFCYRKQHLYYKHKQSIILKCPSFFVSESDAFRRLENFKNMKYSNLPYLKVAIEKLLSKIGIHYKFKRNPNKTNSVGFVRALFGTETETDMMIFPKYFKEKTLYDYIMLKDRR